MMCRTLTRRQLLSQVLAVSGGLVVGSLVGAGCAPAVTTPQAESEEQQAVIPEVQAPAKADQKISIRVQMGGSGTAQMIELADQWNQQGTNIEIIPEETVYDEIPMKTELGAATGDLPDSLFGFTRWHWVGAYKGWYLAMDDLIDAGLVTDYDDFYPVGMENQKFEGKIYGLLDSVYVGPASTITWNRGLFEEAGLDPPDPDMNMIELADLARKVARPEEGIFGIETSVHTPGRLANIARAWGKPDYHAQGDTSTWTTSVDGRQYNLLDNPGAKEFFTSWLTPLLLEGVHPKPEDQVSGGLFVAGRLALYQGHQGHPMRFKFSVGDNWDFHTQDCMILPVGPEGRRGTSWECHTRCIYAETKHPQEAMQVTDYFTSYEAGMISLEITGNRAGRRNHSQQLCKRS